MAKLLVYGTFTLTTLIAGALSTFGANLEQASPGLPRFEVRTDPSWDRYTAAPDDAMKQFFDSRVWRMMVYAPYFNSRLAWYPNALVYINLYAIPVNSLIVKQHPDWILRDADGQRLYIPYDCKGGSCPQYAADVSNEGYRAAWLDKAARFKQLGYKGFWVDDVNLAFRVSDGDGKFRAPMIGGRAMTSDEWQQNIVNFLEVIRRTFPDTEILHNSIWFAGNAKGEMNPAIQRDIASCDYVNVERGVTDKGLKGGNGDWSLNAMFSYIDRVHGMGRGVVLDNTGSDFDYGLAGFYMISTGVDAMGAHAIRPPDWPKALTVDLGSPVDRRRTTWKGLLVRRFARGIAVINPPGSSTRHITLDSSFQNEDASQGQSVDLQPAGGLVAVGSVTPGTSIDKIIQVD